MSPLFTSIVIVMGLLAVMGIVVGVANDAVMMKSAVPAPAVSAGESTLTMRVGMEVRILPKN